MRESTLLGRSPAGSPTYREFGLNKLHSLLEGLGLGGQSEKATQLFDLLTESFSFFPLGAAPLWPSDITDDGTPFEFSVAFSGGEPSVRILAEAQRPPFNHESAWQAALAVNERLSTLPGVDLERFAKIAALFEPQVGTPARFGLWHAGELRRDGSLAFKAYLNPRVAGADHAPALVREALECLDAGYVWVDFTGEDSGAPTLAYGKVYGVVKYAVTESFDIGANVYYGSDYINGGAEITHATAFAKYKFTPIATMPELGAYISGSFSHMWTSKNFVPDYSFWDAGAALTYKGLTLDFRYNDNNLSKRECGLEIGHRNACGDRYLVSLSFDTSISKLK